MLSRIHVAIVGSGPSGFYTAMELLDCRDYDFHVDMYDRLPTPGGLVRNGVAPDHPKTKAVLDLFQRYWARPNFGFYLNVEIGKDVSHEELTTSYHAVIYCYGASSAKTLNVPGESLEGCFSANEFVAWYNGHPDYMDLRINLSTKRVVVIGNGNVALDVARLLVKSPDELSKTDIADHALQKLRESHVEEVVVVGRRGVADAAYTSPELLSLGDLDGVDVVIDPGEFNDEVGKQEGLDSYTRHLKTEIAKEFSERPLNSSSKRIVLRYRQSPIDVHGGECVESVDFVKNELVAQDDGSTRAVATDIVETLDAGLVLSSIGYVGRGIPGLPFDDDQGVIPNEQGRVVSQTESADSIRGVYCGGWIKRGPSGVIGTNKHCARETIAMLIEDVESGLITNPPNGSDFIDELLVERQVRVVDYAGWRRVNAYECEQGKKTQRPRVKLTNSEDVFSIASQKAV